MIAKTKMILFSAVALIAGATAMVDAAETPRPKALVPAHLDGTIVALNKREKTVIVDVKGRFLTVNITGGLRLTRGGKQINFDELAPGQAVSLTFVEMANGQIEVASMSVSSSSEGLEAAGPKPPGSSRNVPTLPPQAPFNTPPNPANLNGPPVSKHK